MSVAPTEEAHPIAASAQGNNTCLVKCGVYNGMRHYAVCLRVIRQFDAGTPSDNDPDCNARLMDGDGCPAYEMLAKERAAGKALFYQPREQSSLAPMPKGVTIFDRSYQRGWAQPNKPSSPTREPSSLTRTELVTTASPTPAPKPVAASSDYAELVNHMMKEEAAKTNPPAPRTGLLETVRRMREQQVNEK
jgi:hypothetical protein